jgi:hypothetical protein
MAKYRVNLHGHAGMVVEVEADSIVDANRKAIEKAPKVKYVSQWTPVATSRMIEDEKEQD